MRSLPLLLFIVASLLIYGHSASFDFVYDDLPQITLNSAVRGDVPWYDALTTPTFPGNLYRPLPTLSYVLTAKLAGLNSGIFHLTNVVLHGLVAWLVFQLFSILLKAPSLAVAGALVFLAHPLTVEPVVNVVGRAELLAALFGIAAVLSALHSRSPTTTSLLFLGATLSKESAFALAPLIFLAVRSKNPQALQRNVLGITIVGSLSLIARAVAVGSLVGIASDSTTSYAENPLFHLPALERLYPSLAVLGRYLEAFVVPLNLSADYSTTPTAFLMWAYSLDGVRSAFLTLFILGMLLVKSSRGRFFVFWFFGTFALTSNLFIPIGTIQADRLAYTPIIGVIGLVMVGLEHLGVSHGERRPTGRLPSWRLVIQPPILLLWILALATTSLERSRVWKDKGTLFAQTAIDSPTSPKAMYHYGLVLYVDEKRLHDAIPYFEKAVALDSSHLRAMKCLADIALALGDRTRLRYWYTRILEIDPKDSRVIEYLNLLVEQTDSSALDSSSATSSHPQEAAAPEAIRPNRF